MTVMSDCICDRRCPVTEDQHWVNCPAHAYHANYLSMTAAIPSVEAGRYLADRFEWAAPGDQQEDAWLVRFCDRDCGDAVFTGPDAEAEAWEHWQRYAPAFNIYVFRLARLRPLSDGRAGSPGFRCHNCKATVGAGETAAPSRCPHCRCRDFSAIAPAEAPRTRDPDKVIQADRDAAAAFYAAHLAREDEVPVAAAMRAGHIDGSPLIKAFALHRRRNG